MHIGIKLTVICTAYEYTDLGYITNSNLIPTALQKKKTKVAGIDSVSKDSVYR